jgi:hypothetical protein
MSKQGPKPFVRNPPIAPCLTYHAQREQKHHSKDGVSLQHRPRVPSSFSSEKMLVQLFKTGVPYVHHYVWQAFRNTRFKRSNNLC